MPIVRRSELANVVKRFEADGFYALDTETDGLSSYLGDTAFSLILCDASASWYFNFQEYQGISSEWVLDRKEVFTLLAPAFSNPKSTFFMHNSKFDLGFLAKEGAEIAGRVHCTEAVARILYNKHFDYTLAACAKRIGLEKSKAVDEYIKKHKLYTKYENEQGKEIKKPHFDRVPFHIITEYGLKDGEITYQLGLSQLEELAKIDAHASRESPSLNALYENETALTKTCFEMERVGCLVDLDYCRRAYSYEVSRADAAAKEFETLAGVEFKDSNKVLAAAFTKVGEVYPVTEKGNPSFTDEVLSGFTSPLAKHLQTYRDASKKANTYYANFIKFADTSGRIHANIRQAGTDTGRVSCQSPNLQNLSKETESAQEFSVRRAFIPAPGFCFVMIDMDQMEYRLMLDYAAERGVIDKILNEGLDVHQATAEQMKVTRNQAKTLNFLLLYGGGVEKLAKALGLTVPEARELRSTYFAKLPRVKAFTRMVMEKAEKSKVVFNWLGRRCHFENPEFTYAAPNHLIQGGCADVIKISLNRTHEFLKGKKSRLLMSIHDEALLEIHKDEFDLVPSIVKIMEAAYPFRHLPLTCSVSHSWKSWADKEKGYPKEP